MEFGLVKKLKVLCDFRFENISLNSGVILLKKIDSKIRLLRKIANRIEACRVRYKCKHSIFSMISQRVFALALGEKNLNNHNEIRNDFLMQTVLGTDKVLASPATLCRFEKSFKRKYTIFFLIFLLKIF